MGLGVVMITRLWKYAGGKNLSRAFSPVGGATGVRYTRRSADGIPFSVPHSELWATQLSLSITFDMSEEGTRIQAGSRHLANYLLRRHAMASLVHVAS